VIIKKDQITGVTLVLLGLVIALLVSKFRIDFQPEYPGPRLFPLISVFGFVVCGMGIFIKNIKSKKEEKIFLKKDGWIRAGVTFGILILYVLTMMWLGFLITTPLVVFSLVTLFDREKKSALLNRIVFSVLFSLAVYIAYVYVFGLRLPSLNIFF